MTAVKAEPKCIIYASFMCSESYFSELFKNSDHKPGQAVQKYNRLLAEGLAADPDTTVYSVSEIPINGNNHKKIFYKGDRETVNGVRYRYVPLINIHGIKDIGAVFSCFLRCLKIIRRSKGNTCIIADILNAPAALGAFAAARITRSQYIAVVTDLPEYVYFAHDRIYSYFSSKLLKNADKYVFLTEQMSLKKNRRKKPYTVIEGLVDIREENIKPDPICGIRRVVYTGSIHKKYGIGMLVEGFIKAGPENTELHIYGNGDMKEELEKLSLKYGNISYHGNVIMEEAVKAQREAYLLVNPRPSAEEYTNYSFPSKTMEYMVSSRPVLMTKLGGMPLQYHEYVYLLEDETVEGMAEALKNIFEKDPSELSYKGAQARDFVLKNKNNVSQARKLVRELELL